MAESTKFLSTGLVVSAAIIMALPARAATLPSCGSAPPLSTSPVATTNLSYILPLGNLNPPDHTIPSDHIYFVLPGNETGLAQVKPVVAPGNIHVTAVNVLFVYTGGKLTTSDYALEFGVCAQVSGKFGHLSSLSSALKSKLGKWTTCTSYPAGTAGQTYKACQQQVRIPVKAGASLGTAGGQTSVALDMWMFDTRARRPVYANANRYTNTQMFMTVCPLKYFRTAAASTLWPLVDGYGQPRTTKPLCGAFAQDKPETLQGNWFYGQAKDVPTGWTKELALVHDNTDGTTGAISIGGVLAQAGTWYFSPEHSGTTNREFGEIKPGSTLYCYQASRQYKTQETGRILIQLQSTTTLRIERQPGKSCAEPFAFVSPRTYKR